jgi:RNA polymerase sigma-70 factor (ECF subfamily)
MHDSDELELEAIFREHRPRLLAWLARRFSPALAQRLDPEDVLQEAFQTARGKYASFKAQAELAVYPWLCRVVRDCYHRQWERHTRECRNVAQEMAWPDGSSIQLGLGLIATGTSPSAAAARQEQQRRVLLVLQELSEDDKDLLTMRYWDGFSFAEIAEVLGIEEPAARMRHVRALKHFTDEWNRPGRTKEANP